MKRVGAVVTAAGYGRRYGVARKLHALLDGRPVLAWTLDALREAALAPVVVVTAADDTMIAAIAAAAGAVPAINPDPARGLGASIACGLRALPPGLDGVLVVLGDMPRVRPASIAALLERFDALGPEAAVLPVHQGRRGHPVLFGAAHFAALADLSGDQGARAVLANAEVSPVEVDDPGVLLDIDTPGDLAAASLRYRRHGAARATENTENTEKRT